MSCPDCFKGAVHSHGTPRGKIQQLYGYDTYITTPSGDNRKDSQILFITDAFGLKLINNKLLADQYADQTGCKVLVPDLIPGHGCEPSLMNSMDAAMEPLASYFDFWGLLNKISGMISAAWVFIPFMLTSGAPKAYPETLRYAREMRNDLPQGGKLGVCGFCWGGYGSTNLCTETITPGGSERLIDAQFNAHPSFLKAPDMVVDAVTKFKVPYSAAVASEDFMFNTKVADQTEAAIRQKVGNAQGYEYEFVEHKGCKHGFAVRAGNNPAEKAGEDAARKQAIDWFNKFL